MSLATMQIATQHTWKHAASQEQCRILGTVPVDLATECQLVACLVDLCILLIAPPDVAAIFEGGINLMT